MQLKLTTAELYFHTLRNLGLDAKLVQRDNLYKVVTPHTITIVEDTVNTTPDGVVSVYKHE